MRNDYFIARPNEWMNEQIDFAFHWISVDAAFHSICWLKLKGKKNLNCVYLEWEECRVGGISRI